jgi:tetratricopeptide (TPR) repeat protein
MATPDPRLDQALELHQAGRMAEATALYRQVLAADAGNFDALHMLGVALCQGGQAAEGVPHLRAALQRRPQSKAARLSLAQGLLQAKAPGEALPHFAALSHETPPDVRALLGEVQCLVQLQRGSEALARLAAEEQQRKLPPALVNERGKARTLLGQYDAALADHAAALRGEPANLDAAFHLGRMQMELGHLSEAEGTLTRLLAKAPQHGPAKLALAAIYRQLSRNAEAMALARAVAERAPRNGAAKVMLAMTLVDTGQTAEAEAMFRAAIAQGAAVVDAVAGLAQIHRFTAADPEPALVRHLLANPHLAARDRQSLLYTQAKMADDLGDPGGAVAAATAAKAALPLADQFGPYESFARGCMAMMDRAFFDERRHKGLETQQPVFIVGMPRSGTSLVEQIIAAHPQAEGAGELQALPQLAGQIGGTAATPEALVRTLDRLDGAATAALGRRYLMALQADRPPGLPRITDKLPHNFQNLWLTGLLFPNARIVQCRRHPVDVCLSIYLRHFGRGHWYAQSLAGLGRFYKFHEELTAHWRQATGLRWHEVSYESLVVEPEPNIRALIGFLDLGWNDACLDPWRVERSVSTFSTAQVRQPIYTSAVARWKKYAPYIKPLLDELGIEA